jgi:hypothetical protein
MVKWIWRLFSDDNNNLLWVRLLKAKYRVSKFFLSQPTNCSPFWHSLHKIKHAFKLGARFHPGRASKVCFWKDVWIGETALAQSFPNLFAKCTDPDITICQAYSEEGWNIQFRRNFNQENVGQWQGLLDILQATQLPEEPDKISWRLEPSGKFSTKSLYQALCKGPTFPVTKLIWSPSIPLKIKSSPGKCSEVIFLLVIRFMLEEVLLMEIALSVEGRKMLTTSSSNVSLQSSSGVELGRCSV